MDKKTSALILGIIMLVNFIALVQSDSDANHEEIFARAEEIINAQTPCNLLTQNDLEVLGDYYMEQMHPGDAHKIMDERMGGEGSESLKFAHINMGSRFYCGTNSEVSSNYGMMDRGMMNSGDWNNYSSRSLSYWFMLWIIIILIIISLVLVILLLIKKINSNKK